MKLPFKVTGAKDGNLDERNALTRPGPLGRLWSLHHSEGILWHLALFLLIVLLAYVDVCTITSRSSGSEMWHALLSGPLFPGLRLDQIVWFLSPIRYALSPPTMKDRFNYMFKAYPQHAVGGYRPLPEYRGVRFTKKMYLDHIPYAYATIWAGVVLAKAASML